MSIQAVAWVLEHSVATLADRLVLLAIANHADARGWNAWPRVEQIGLEARVDRRTVYRSIETLEMLGELTVHRRQSKTSIYGITALMGCQDATPGGCQDATQGVTSTAKRGGTPPPEPSLTIHEPSRGRARATSTQSRLPPELPDDVKAKGAEFFKALRRGEQPA